MIARLAGVRWLWLTLPTAAVLAGASLVVATRDHNTASTNVLGEKIAGTGTGTSGNSSAGGNTHANSNPNGNDGGGKKTFSIAGGAEGFYPGGTIHLLLTVSNPQNQAMTVESLSASLAYITEAPGVTPGSCAADVSIDSWTGSAFLLDKSAQDVRAPGDIPVTLSHDAPDACQGATYHFNYSGKAVSK